MDTDPEAWRAEPAPEPTWRRWTEPDGTDVVDADGARTLLTAACLPEAELLHMGCPPWLLEPRPVRGGYVPILTVAKLLGRIAWDADHGARGAVWAQPDLPLTISYGALILTSRFRAC